jgi:hypothetical protein
LTNALAYYSEVSITDKKVLQNRPQDAGKVSLKIKDIGPGDEGAYCCTISNPYGHMTATLSVSPDVNRRHRGLSPGCCRATLQKRLRQQQRVQKLTNGDHRDESLTL